jgi:alpha-amylase
VDIDMDCSKTENGWFELKAVVNGQWENNIRSDPCTGAGSVPAPTKNHWAKCGKLNVFHFNDPRCEIKDIL